MRDTPPAVDHAPAPRNLGSAIGRSVVVFLVAVLTWQTVSSCSVFPPGSPGFLYMIWKAGVVLPLHEAGHFISSPFGYAMTIFGGSFWQVAFPLLLLAVALRQHSFWWTVYLTLAGVHMVDLTPYIFDAPFRSLPLITRNKHTHDWGNLLNHFQAVHRAELLADIAFYGGLLFALAGLLSAAYLIARPFVPIGLSGILRGQSRVQRKRIVRR